MADKIMTPLDEMINEEPLQLLKAAIPYCPSQGQKMLSLYAKTMELKQTMKMLQSNDELSMCSNEALPSQPLDMLTAMSRYCNPNTKERIDNIVQTFATIQLFQMFQENEEET